MIPIDPPIIALKTVSKKYPPDISALFNIDLEIGKGEFVFLTGASGSGKSTFLRLIYGAELPTAGEILLEGISMSTLTRAQLPFLRRKIGVIFQDFKLLNDMTVCDNVALSLEVTGLKREQIQKRVHLVLEHVGLAGKGGKRPLQLSGGEQQRVAIARAVVNRPAIILADEPTGNLDRQRTDEVMTLMEELNARGTTIIFATHNDRLYTNTHRRILHLRDGCVEEVR